MNPHVSAMCLAWIVVAPVLSMTAKGTAPMANTADPVPLCVGRLVADFPGGTKSVVKANFQYVEEHTKNRVTGFAAVKRHVEQSAKNYDSRKIIHDPYADKLARAAGLDPDRLNSSTQLLGIQVDGQLQQAIIGYQPDAKSIGMVADAYKVIDGVEYVFRSKFDGADAYPATSQRMWSAVRHFQPLARGEVPTTPGFCVAGGMFADDGHPPLHESFTLVASFKDHPDARFVIDAHAIAKVDTDEPSLKHRVDGELGILRANVEGHVAVLVRGERDAAGQKGFQIGLGVPNDTVPNTTAYKFFWAADGTPNDASRPAMEVSLTIQPEDDKPASFADARQAQALWDELLQGLRIRPGSVAR